ncbi:putative bifunctional phosphatase/peptidyl-prolyl cis-trans isomerase [Andreprevotia sp. IGB-42]|uniref:peptidylprolyl isomerase n=1 Tax=Andreprevotia sp. IGB-42 TaxID=2497473 RepID=UPI0013581546|nr:peptidylprolyl isomerase [Andreprevotia sp. IGB-42]KAF0811454.1 putative bifunctional phosphatase/peptidyl-prolyl cis-trans isomerase [Andreprevotia sp. IGB-42]
MKPILVVTLLGISLAMPIHALAAKASKAPATVNVQCKTSKGDLDIVVEPAWAPLGAARFLQMVDDGYFKQVPLFRCVNNFLCQLGALPPRKDAKNYSPIADDTKQPALRNFKRGYLSFAGSGPNSRATHLFITLGDKIDSLGTMSWETPFGYIAPASLGNTVGQFNTGYGDMPPWGNGPDPQKIEAPDGAAYLKKNFPQLDYINSCTRR